MNNNPNDNLKKFVWPAFFLLLFIVVLWGLFTYLNTGQLAMTTKGNSKITIEPVDGDSTKKLTLLAGSTKTLQLHKGNYRVSAESGDIKSMDIISIKGKFAKTAVTVPIGEIRAIKKLGSNAEFCPLYIQNVTYSYDCQTNSGLVLRHVPINATSGGLMFGGQMFGFLKPYQNGLLGFGTNGDGSTNYDKLIYLDMPSDAVKNVDVPSYVSQLLAKEVPRVITPTDTTKSYFALSFKKADKTYIFKSMSDPSPVLVDLKVKTSEAGRLSAFSFSSNDQLVLYAGTQSETHDEGEVFSEASDANRTGAPSLDNYFFDYNLSGQVTETTRLPKNFGANNAAKLINGYYVANVNEGVVVYYKDGDKLRIVTPAYDVASWVVIGGKLYMQQDGTIYEFEAKGSGLFSLHSLFTSTGIRTSQLFYSQAGLIFTGFSQRASEGKLDIYALTNDKKTTPPLEEAMPISKISGLAIDYDYDDTTIQFTPLVITGSTYESSLSSITAAIHAMHIDTGNREIQLAPIVNQ